MDSVDPLTTTKSRSSSSSPSSLVARRRRLEIRRFRFFANSSDDNKNTSSTTSSTTSSRNFLEPALKKARSSPASTLADLSTLTSNLLDVSDTSKVNLMEQEQQQQQHLSSKLNGWCHSNTSQKVSREQQAGQKQGGEADPSGTSSNSSGTTSATITPASGSTTGSTFSSSNSVLSGVSCNRSSKCAATDSCPPHGAIYICGRRREMEDAVAVVPSFMSVPCGTVSGCDCHLSVSDSVSGLGPGSQDLVSGSSSGPREPSAPRHQDLVSTLHFFGVYDGHGGSQVAAFCKEHLHAAVIEELGTVEANLPGPELDVQLKRLMVSSFLKVDAQVGGFLNSNEAGASGGEGGEESPSSAPKFVAPETSGSTAVVAVLGSNRIIVANCGDSRAVLSRGGRAIPLSRDHKPDQVDELARVEAAGGRVIFWNGYRVLGVLAMSRAIGDRYLKPFIIPEPDVTCTERSEEDECLILASDGLWDVLSNEVACDIARKCLFGRHGNNNNNRNHSNTSRREDSNAELAAGILTKYAIAKGSCDNISVVVVDLKSRRGR